MFDGWGTRTCIALLAILAGACSGSSLPTTTGPGDQLPGVGGPGAYVAACGDVSSATITDWLATAFAGSPDENAVLGKWANIQHQVNVQGDLANGRQKVFTLVDFMRGKEPLTISDEDLVALYNALFCFVGIDAGIEGDFWIVYVGDPLTTFVTGDGLSGIQFPANAVLENTVVTARQVNPTALTTLLDKYPFVYDWDLSPAQTLPPGIEATVGVCPSAESLAGVDPSQLDALLDRLVLGHQVDDGEFEVLARVPIPAAMVLDCGEVADPPAQLSLSRRVIDFLTDALLPDPAHAATLVRKGVGGVGGSTSEFSPFGPVDSELRGGGVGGSTSEFLRAGSLLEAALTGDLIGTVGTRLDTAGAVLPSVAITTYRGTPIPGITVEWTTGAPLTSTPVGNASVCGAESLTDGTGNAAVTCLDFGTTVQYRTAYTKLSASVTLPAELAGRDSNGDPIVTVVPAVQNWRVASSGPSKLKFTAPNSAATVTAGSPITATVEIHSDLDKVVPIATNTVILSVDQGGTFLEGGGSVASLSEPAVAGVASFQAALPIAADYIFTATAQLADIADSVTATSEAFTVEPGAPAQISLVDTAGTGTVVDSVDYGARPPGANLVSPSPQVLVTDAYGNPTPDATVYWTPGGSDGAEANGSPGTTTTVTTAGGFTEASWLLAEGDNQLRASLQSTAGPPEVFFYAHYSSSYSVINACAPGGAKDAITDYYLKVPGPKRGLLHSIGMYLSATGSVGQTDVTEGYEMELEVSRMNGTTLEVYTSNARAFLRGDNGASSIDDRLVTFVFDDIGPVGGNEPELTIRFIIPEGGYARKINFNAGICGPGRCRPPTECVVKEYELPLGSTDKPYRQTTGLIIRGF